MRNMIFGDELITLGVFIFKNIKIYSNVAVVAQKFTIFAFKSY